LLRFSLQLLASILHLFVFVILYTVFIMILSRSSRAVVPQAMASARPRATPEPSARCLATFTPEH
jgi:hypothetical protein